MKITEVKKSRKNYPDFKISKGEGYFFVRPRKYHVKRVLFKTNPEAQKWIKTYMEGFRGEQAIKIEEFNSRLENLCDEDEKEELINDITEFISEKEERLENLPDQLKESHVLNEQIEELQEILSSVEEFEIEE